VFSAVKSSSSLLLATLALLASVAFSAQQPTRLALAAREDAYRANNLGVARLEQFDYPAAAQSFRRALEIDTNLAMARVNLAIALYYAGELAPARQEAEAAQKQDASLLQAGYVLGLIARADNRNAEAIAAFDRVQRADPNDVGSAINLELYPQEQKFGEAIDAFQRATRLEPYQSTAAYGLATALLRSGARDEGAAAMAQFQKLRDSGYATTFSQNYLEQGRYAAALASTGAEPALVDRAVPEVGFSDRTRETIPELGTTPVSGLTLFDKDSDGDLDLALATSDGVMLFRNDGGRFTDLTARFGLAGAGAATAIVAGDYDNDERPDLLVLSSDRSRLFHQQPDGSWKDVTATAALPSLGGRTAAWADADHDGDLDIVAPPRLLRNNGNGTFTDVSASSGMSAATEAIATAPTDYDNRRDIDFLVLRGAGKPLLFQNMRDGSFRDASETAGLVRDANWTAAAAGDVNKDGFVDFFFGPADGPGVFAMSDGHGRFTVSDAPAETAHALAAQLLDYDNDGLLDLLVVTAQNGVALVRNRGTGWSDETRSFSEATASGAVSDRNAAIAAGDLDGDGDTDVILAQGGIFRIWRNDGGNRYRSLKVQLSARVSNRSAVGAKVEIRAGSLSQQLETVAPRRLSRR
jgi:tetratricopeptide (TPR) repeat protein